MADSTSLPIKQPAVPDGIKAKIEEVLLDSPPATFQGSTALKIKTEPAKDKKEDVWLETTYFTPSVSAEDKSVHLKSEALNLKYETDSFVSHQSPTSSLNTSQQFLQSNSRDIKSDMDHVDENNSEQEPTSADEESMDSEQDPNPVFRKRGISKPQTTFECKQCGLTFSRKDNFIVHTYIHSGKKPHSCSVCQKTFSRADGLAVHMRFHTGERPYECDQCGKGFTTSAHLREHQFIHTGTKPYACQHCDKSFGHPNDLTRHNKMHTGERPYPCSKCEMTFRRSHTLQKHVFRKHERKSSFPCSTCGRLFKTEGHLGRHVRSTCNKKH